MIDSSTPNQEAAAANPAWSKRAALRLIQRAWVLTGRDRAVRQRVRATRLTTRWALRDWRLEWTVGLDRGTVRFGRRPARQPEVIFSWPSAEEFFRNLEAGCGDRGLETEGDPQARRATEFVRRIFLERLRQVIQYPFNDEGQRLA